MDDNKNEKDNLENGSARGQCVASCYLLPCPFCGVKPTEDSTGMIVCKSCLKKDNAVASPNADTWNNRHVSELSEDDLRLLMIAVERWADDLDNDIEMSNFAQPINVERLERLNKISTKIRLFAGRERLVSLETS